MREHKEEYSFLADAIVLFSFFKESRCSRPINVTEFGQILRRCLDLPKIVRQ